MNMEAASVEHNPVLAGRENACCGCGACVLACPVQCIKMQENAEGFLYPDIDVSRCVHCNKCRSVCPVLAGGQKKSAPYEAWAARANDKEIQISSTSGGVFSVIAEQIIKEGGCVFGAAFTEDFHRVHHVRADDLAGLAALRTSKYLQSDTGAIFSDVRAQLSSGRRVLFSGTPCQVAGLKAYLGRDDDNLITVAVICHGIPSPRVWGRYLDHLSSWFNGRVNYVNFRHKNEEEKQSAPNNGGKMCGEYYRERASAPYSQMFLRDYCLRESCYQCFVKENGYAADLVIGDFWGIQNILPDMADRMGTSLALIHTGKGKRVFEALSPQMTVKRADFESAIQANPSYTSSVARPNARNTFFEDLDALPWNVFENKYVGIPFKTKIRRRLGAMYRALKAKLLKMPKGNHAEYGLMIRFGKE